MRALLLILAVLVAVPAYAAPTFADVVNNSIVPFVDKGVVPLLYVIAFLFFVFGVMRYFFTGGEENRQKAKDFIIWSLVGMVVIFGVWGIVNLLLTVIPS